MKLKLIAPLLLSLFAGSAFAHGNHDDDAPQPPTKQEASAPKPKSKHSHDAAAKQDKAATETPADPAAAEPKKTP